ncbi:hypothetical protein FGG08_006429 [Glutinoglossum americanum]|uniref:AAA+ ATPase domain-containing protein n=1 Tax=Glutinoglossum americanum TaxID=1670608 RepID=A0A9P8I0X2_9PEZI|nr:hypothetical protein FGG08_006429 [Glutinoglossum americanum]
MYYSSPPTTPYLSDPAIFFHSEAGDTADSNHIEILPPYTNNSDDLEALHAQQDEATAEKSKRGQVIQHRAWKVADAFRSDGGYQAESPLRGRTNLSRGIPRALASEDLEIPPSSPPMTAVAQKSHISAMAMTEDVDPGCSGRGKGRAGLAPYKGLLDKYRGPGPSQAGAIADAGKETVESIQESLHDFAPGVGPFIADDSDSGDSRLPTSQRPSGGNINPISRPLDTINDLNQTQFPSLPCLPLGGTACSTGKREYSIRTCSGRSFEVSRKPTVKPPSFEQLISSRSLTAPGRAQKSYYGIDVHKLLDEISRETRIPTDQTGTGRSEDPRPSIEEVPESQSGSHGKTMLWTEKYRAKAFTDLIGDERTHRSVLRWLKGWDPIVFPRQGRTKAVLRESKEGSEERSHRKILLLTGPPGLGKTTLAHVAAKQAGYEALEINASDERSKSVVEGRIRDSLGTETVRIVGTKSANGRFRKAGKPVCIVVDEVDGVVSGAAGAGAGEGGFVKALIDLVALDQRNSSSLTTVTNSSTPARKRKKGGGFRFLRPLILICNDVYHPSLRPLRQSSVAEVIHVRKPPLSMVVSRMKTIFEKEGLSCDGDGVRRLCEATWGLNSRREASSASSGISEGDIRGVMVVGEWVAGKLRSSLPGTARLTRRWVEQHIIGDLGDGGTGARGLGRGGAKEIVQRVFLEGAGFPKPTNLGSTNGVLGEYGVKTGVAEFSKRKAMEWLREKVDSGGECDWVITDCFSTYLSQPYQDDTLLSKPNAAYDWLHFYDTLNSRIFAGQEWELNPYLSQPVLSFHHLFASSARHAQTSSFGQTRFGEDGDGEPAPFTGPKADFTARGVMESNRALLQTLQSSLSIPLLRLFRSPEDIATDLVSYLNKILTPDIKPVVIGGSGDQRGIASVRRENEREMVRRAAGVMAAVGVTFERGRVELGAGGRDGGWVYRMEPPIDTLATFETSAVTPGAAPAPIRYAVRQVLDQEYHKEVARRDNEARQARYRAGNPGGGRPFGNKTQKDKMMPRNENLRITGAKRDFFGRIINEAVPRADTEDADETEMARKKRKSSGGDQENTVWISYHEGFSNAVRKPITLEEILRGL